MVSSPVVCEACQSSNRADAKFCSKCGKQLPRYILLREVGQGGFGVVYEAEDRMYNRPVAIKEINPSQLSQQERIEAITAFNNEANLLAQLIHPNLPRIYEHFEKAGHWYLVMDFIKGETLEKYLEKAIDGRLPIEEVLAIGIQLCTVLDYLHNQQPPIIFRDLKPLNIMRTTAGEILLIDFGIARLFKPGQAKDTRIVGSPGYAAPEQYGKAQTTTRADVYSLGAVLHQLLSGKDPSENIPSPFDFRPLKSYIPRIPTELDTLILQMLDRDLNKRPANIAYIKKKLEDISFHLRTRPSIAVRQPVSSTPPVAALQFASQTYSSPATLHVFKGHKKEVYSLTWSPDSKCLASASGDRTVRVWNVVKKDVDTIYQYSRAVKVVAWSYDRTYLASMSTNQVVQVRNFFTGDILRTYEGHVTSGMGFAFSLAWSPDSRYITSGSDNNKVFVWDAASGSDVSSFHGHESWISAVAWSPDGNYIASGSNDRTMQVWDALSGTHDLTYNGHTGEVCAVAWSPDSKLLASAHRDQIKVWDVANKDKPLATYNHHKGVNAVVWSPDGNFIASGGNDSTVQIWGVITQRIVFVYTEHLAPVRTVAWSPDGKRIASGDEDKLVCLWEIK